MSDQTHKLPYRVNPEEPTDVLAADGSMAVDTFTVNAAYSEAVARAEYVVMACNAYYDLIDGLKATRNVIEICGGLVGYNSVVLDRINAVLAKHGGAAAAQEQSKG